jgi:peroxiredoxin
MLQKISTLLLLGFLLTVAPYYGFAQVGNPAPKIEALKKLEPVDPFKMTSAMGASFDPQKGEELYFEDGKKINFEQFQTYVARAERDYIVVPYVNPADKGKVVAMLVRKAIASELEQMKALMAGQAGAQKMYASEVSDPSDPSSMESIKFDPNLKAKDYIKGLKKMGKSRMTTMNIGRIAIFDMKGNLIPISEGKEPYERYFKYTITPEIEQDVYIDDDEVIRALVLREATMEERKKRQNIASSVRTEKTGNGGDGGGITSGGDAMTGSAKLKEGVKVPTNAPAMPGTFSADSFKKKFGVGSEAKTFKAVDVNGNEVDLAAFKGRKTVVLNFWFTACKPCVQEMPELNKLVASMKGKDVEFISICNDVKEDAKDFLTKIKYDYRCIPDGLGIANQYNVLSFPTHLVINKKGEIVLLQQGYSDNLIPQIKAEITKDQK